MPVLWLFMDSMEARQRRGCPEKVKSAGSATETFYPDMSIMLEF